MTLTFWFVALLILLPPAVLLVSLAALALTPAEKHERRGDWKAVALVSGLFCLVSVGAVVLLIYELKGAAS
jgi:hypothetical protein